MGEGKDGEGMDEGEVGERSPEVAKEESACMVMAGHMEEEDDGTANTGDVIGLDLEPSSAPEGKSDTNGPTRSGG